MAMDRELDVFTNYRNITNKIKKRFLKKPNYTEASEQFGTLTRVLKQQECPQYAGFCCLAKARCESILGNSAAEVESLLEAARCRYFLPVPFVSRVGFWCLVGVNAFYCTPIMHLAFHDTTTSNP